MQERDSPFKQGRIHGNPVQSTVLRFHTVAKKTNNNDIKKKEYTCNPFVTGGAEFLAEFSLITGCALAGSGSTITCSVIQAVASIFTFVTPKSSRTTSVTTTAVPPQE